MKKNILITGASKGIGADIAKHFLEKKHQVINISRTSNEVLSKYSNYYEIKCDLASESSFKYISHQLEKLKISPDILINNAGYGGDFKKFYNYTEEDWESILHVNLMAPFFLSKLVFNNMKTNKWGRIINIGSIYSMLSSTKSSIYSISKHGLVGLTKSLAIETIGTGITVNMVSPSFVLTNMTSNREELDILIENLPNKDLISTQSIIEVIDLLILSNTIQGQNIVIDNGLINMLSIK